METNRFMSKDILVESILLTFKFFEAVEYLPTRQELLDFFITKDLDKQFKRDEINACISELIESKNILVFDEIYLGLNSWDFATIKRGFVERVRLSKAIVKKLKKYSKFFKLISPIVFVSVYGKFSETNFLILSNELNLFHKFILRILKIKNPIVMHEADFKYKNHDIRSAFYLLKMPHVFAKAGAYEKFIFKNPWIFDYFGNYPVDKISLNYKVVL